MNTVTISTCGTSIFTNGTNHEDVKFLRDNANKNKADYSKKDIERIENIISEKREKLLNASPNEVRALSAELNGFISFYGSGSKLDAAAKDVHYLIHTDTYQGVAASELIREWGEKYKISMTPILIADLNTGSIEEFRLGINNLVEWCVGTLPGYRDQKYKIIFNLVGGFKSLQGYMQTLGMFYADETVYIFETGGELLRIPKMPVDFAENAKQSVLNNFEAFRRMQRECLSRSECSEIPETLLDIVDGKCTLSAWGQIIWEEVQRDAYSERILEPVSKRIIISPTVFKTAKTFSRDKNRIMRLNQAIDKLSRHVETYGKERLNSCNMRQLSGDPVPPSTHEFNLWPDMGGWRGFCHWDENNNLVIDDIDMGLGHNKH